MGIPPTIQVATVGMWDTLILMVLALVVFGPRRLPQLARQLGRIMYEFRKASNDFKYQMEEELRVAEEADRRKKEEQARTSEAPATETASLPASVEEPKPADPYAELYPQYSDPAAFAAAEANVKAEEEKKAQENAPTATEAQHG